MKTPLVSICIPTFNRPEFLHQTILSCLNQTYKHYEIIIMDTSKNNKTKKLVQKIKTEKIKYYQKNVKRSEKSNLLISKAKGKYIKLLFDDDLIHPDHLSKMVAIMEKYPNVGIVTAPLQIINESGQLIQPKFYLIKNMTLLYKYLNHSALVDKKIILKDFLTSRYPCCVSSGILFRKKGFDILGGHDKKAGFTQDLDLCMNFATCFDFYYIDEVLSSWRYSSQAHTVNLHKEGVKSHIFYYLVKKYCKDKKLLKDSYYFASKRTFLLNLIAAIKSRNFKLMMDTFNLINKNDPYFTNKLKLPLTLFQEIFDTFKKI